MAASPQFKIYDSHRYAASAKEPEDAVRIAALFGAGSTVRIGHRRVVYRHGLDGNASDSIDKAVLALFENMRK